MVLFAVIELRQQHHHNTEAIGSVLCIEPVREGGQSNTVTTHVAGAQQRQRIEQCRQTRHQCLVDAGRLAHQDTGVFVVLDRAAMVALQHSQHTAQRVAAGGRIGGEPRLQVRQIQFSVSVGKNRILDFGVNDLPVIERGL